MITVKLNNGNTFKASAARESYEFDTKIHSFLTFIIEHNLEELEYYSALLSAEGALENIEVSNGEATHIFKGFTVINNLETSVSDEKIQVKIHLTKPE